MTINDTPLIQVEHVSYSIKTRLQLIIADEPTGNLDSQTAHQVFETLASLTQQGKTVIYVTHDQQLASRATARIDLLDGSIVGQHRATAIVTTL